MGIAVVNYNGGDRTIACIERLRQSTWPAERLRIVLVDNASDDGVVDAVREGWPDVVVVRSPTNTGFGGGCNLAFAQLRDADLIALVNNDALPEPGWLEPLVAALGSDDRLGAVTPKVLLSDVYVRCTIVTEDATAATHRDPRRLGVQLSGVEVDGTDELDDTLARSGAWGWEQDDVTVGGRFRWTAERAELLVPAPPGATRLSLRLACGLGPRHTTIEVGDTSDVGGVTTKVDVGIHPAWVHLDLPPTRERLVNNAGLELRDDGQLADRGYLQPDGPPYDEPVEVFGWSGACVLLRRAYVDDVGGFDDRLFLYYEDGDFAWRGRRRGWRYRYVPDAVVHHERSASVGNVSPLVQHLARRNRLVVLTRNAPLPQAARAVAGVVKDLAAAVWRDVALAPMSGRRPSMAHVVDLARVLGGYVRLLPGTLIRRFAGAGAAGGAARARSLRPRPRHARGS